LASFATARYLEHNIVYPDITNHIYDPYELQKIINNYNITLRIDESYINDLTIAGVSKKYIDKYDDTPYLWIKQFNNNTVSAINEFYIPGTNNKDTYND
jgi:hypothetical protein